MRILISTKFRFIGDTLLAIPVIRAARRTWPDSYICVLTGKNANVLLKHNPYVDEIVEFNPTSTDRGLFAFFRVVNRLRKQSFSHSITLNRSFHSALIPFLSRVRVRAGFDSEGRGLLLNRRVPYDSHKSEISCYFDVLDAVSTGCTRDRSLELWISEQEATKARSVLNERLGIGFKGPLIGIQPGASLPIKRWDLVNFARVAERILRQFPQSVVVLLGGSDEIEISKRMRAALGADYASRCVDLTGTADLRGSLALLSQMTVFLGNDTAILHSAVALNVPTVALFGPTNPEKWGNVASGHCVLVTDSGKMSALRMEDVSESLSVLLSSVLPDEPNYDRPLRV